MKPKITLKLTPTEDQLRGLESGPLSYQVVTRALREAGGEERFVAREELIEAINAELTRIGDYQIKNIAAVVSSFCALPGVEARFEYPGGHTAPFVSKRLVATRGAGPAGGVAAG
jgi:hypothetical protein